MPDLGPQVWASFPTLCHSCAIRLVMSSRLSYPMWPTARENEAMLFFSVEEKTRPVSRQKVAGGTSICPGLTTPPWPYAGPEAPSKPPQFPPSCSGGNTHLLTATVKIDGAACVRGQLPLPVKVQMVFLALWTLQSLLQPFTSTTIV